MPHQDLNFIQPAQHAAIMLSYVNPTQVEIQKIGQRLDEITDWEAYFQLCQRNKVAPINYYNLEAIGLWNKVPTAVQAKFIAEKEKIHKENFERIEEAKNFLQRFVDEGIPVAVIKGSGFAKTIYDNPFYKRMNDIDLLIKFEDRYRIYDIYQELQYFPLGERISGKREQSDRLSHLAPHFVSRNLKCVIGTQWGIKTPLGKWKIDYDAIWSRMRSVDYHGIPMSVMAPEDNLHHLCLHLGYFKIAIRDMMDIFNIPRHHGASFDWTLFFDIVRESNSEEVTYHALMIANRLCPQFELLQCAKQLEGFVSRRYKKNVQKKIRDLDLLLNIFCDQIQKVELAISRFDMTDAPGQKWKAYFNVWKYLLRPTREDAIKMSLLKNPNTLQVIWARLTIPFKIFSVVADEVGWKIVFLLLAKTWFELCKSILTAPFKSKTDRYDWDAYAKDLGLTMQELAKLEKHFQ